MRRCSVVATLIAALGLGACGARAYPVTRRMDGEERAGVYVSPHAYEWFIRGELAAARGDDEAAIAAYREARTGPVDDA
ncbi:MAG: hypothetical protein AAF411_19115, partial [Myxococcota bacterium]